MLHYDYNQRNLLITHTTYVSGTGWVLQAEYLYDGNDDRLRQVDHTGGSPITTTYTNDIFGLMQVLVADNGADQVYNLFGLDLIQQDDSSLRTLLGDGLGSVRMETVGGSVAAVTTYSPYGEVLAQTGTSGTVYGFTGEQEDSATGLLYLRARYYNSYIYRMLTPDTILPDLNNPQSLNLYTYVENNPVLYTDPSGHCIDGITTVPCAIVVGGVVVVVGSVVVVNHATQQLLDTPFVRQGIENLANSVGGFFDNLGEDVSEAIEDCHVVLFRGGPQPQILTTTPTPQPQPQQLPLPFPAPQPQPEPSRTPLPPPPDYPDDRNLVYRNMQAEEHPDALVNGIWAKNPNSN